MDIFLLLKNSKEKIDILVNNNKLEYKDEKDAVDNENFNIFSTRKFIGGNI